MRKISILFFALLSMFTQNIMAQPDQTIANNFEFQLDKYLGTWYEIARFDHKFERGLEKVTAT